MNEHKNADRFTGFADVYENARSEMPQYLTKIICSQSFHWMGPITTLDEINRILKPNGIFATVDCDWPPIANWNAEKAYMELYLKAKEIELSNSNINDTFVRYDKSKHLQNIKKSGHFRYFREILFANTEECTAQRFVNILLSQGSLQAILKVNPNLIKNDIEKFKKEIYNIYDDKTFDIDFCYRVRMGIK
jgi:SAM-dependent methyltransferase